MCKKNSERSRLKSQKHFSFSFLLILALSFSLLSFNLFAQQATEPASGGSPAAPTQPSQGDAGATASAGGVSTDAAVIAKGKELFTGNCTSCHAVSDQRVIGPGLKDVHKRRPLEWIIRFVQNSQKVIQSGGDAYAQKLFAQYDKVVMPPHDMSNEDVTAIVSYIAQESATPAGNTAGAPSDATGNTGEYNVEKKGPGTLLNVLLGAFVVILLLILILLIVIVSVLTKYLKQRADLSEGDRELVDQGINFNQLIRNRTFLGIVAFLFVAIVGKASLDGLYNIGIQQGYAPTQPIEFSHKLHAGQYKIDCNYCHTGVRKSQAANIPSANICMNCHNTIKPESPEIQKIFAAIEDDQPIEWVRIHNLPDHAYFNHSQHVKVAGLECQTCHGPIQEMEVVQQYSPLTMGWCINCHRETKVNAEGNGYYDKLLEAHNSAKAKMPMTVEHIGGLECSKCHY